MGAELLQHGCEHIIAQEMGLIYCHNHLDQIKEKKRKIEKQQNFSTCHKGCHLDEHTQRF